MHACIYNYLVGVASSPARHHLDLIRAHSSIDVGVGHLERVKLSGTVQLTERIDSGDRRPYNHRINGTKHRRTNHWSAETNGQNKLSMIIRTCIRQTSKLCTKKTE